MQAQCWSLGLSNEPSGAPVGAFSATFQFVRFIGHEPLRGRLLYHNSQAFAALGILVHKTKPIRTSIGHLVVMFC